MDKRIEKQLAFSLEIDKVKNIFRQTHLSGNGRNENDAEHSWHMAIMACLLRECTAKNHRLRWIYARRCRRCSKNHVLRKMGFEEHYYT